MQGVAGGGGVGGVRKGMYVTLPDRVVDGQAVSAGQPRHFCCTAQC